jgi:cytochrome c2
MNPNRLFTACLLTMTAVTVACGGGGSSQPEITRENPQAATETAASTASTNPQGIGKYQNVTLTHPLDEKMATHGKEVYELKCASCHKLTDEKLVGPGFAKVTDRRTPEWIMNFVTNTDEMIEKDAAAKQLFEEMLVRMPNQNLTEEDARSVLEYLRKNDGKN